MASGEHAGFPPGPSTDPSWPAQMTRRLGESLFLLNNARITPEAHAAEVAEVLDRIVNSESRGAVSKLLALDTLRDAGLIGDAQLAVQKNTVLAQRTAIDDDAIDGDGTTRGGAIGVLEWENEAGVDPWSFMASDESRLARQMEYLRAKTEGQRARVAEIYRRERLDAKRDIAPQTDIPVRILPEPTNEDSRFIRSRLASAAESASRARDAAASIETFVRDMEAKHGGARGESEGEGAARDAVPGEGDAGMSLGFGAWDDAFKYDVAFAYRPRMDRDALNTNHLRDGEDAGLGSGLLGVDPAVAKARRPWVREGVDAEEEEAAANHSEIGSAIHSPPSETEKSEDDVGQKEEEEGEGVGEETSPPATQPTSPTGPSRTAALLRAASVKEKKEKPKKAGFFSRMFGGKKEEPPEQAAEPAPTPAAAATPAPTAAAATPAEETPAEPPKEIPKQTFEATVTFVGAPPKAPLRLAFVLERRRGDASGAGKENDRGKNAASPDENVVRVIEAELPAGSTVARGTTVHRLVGSGGKLRCVASQVRLALPPFDGKAKPAVAHVDSVSLTVIDDVADASSTSWTQLATFAVNAKVRRGKAVDPGLDEVRASRDASREAECEVWAERRTKPKSEGETPRRYWYSKSRKTSTFKEPVKYHPVETEGRWALVKS